MTLPAEVREKLAELELELSEEGLFCLMIISKNNHLSTVFSQQLSVIAKITDSHISSSCSPHVTSCLVATLIALSPGFSTTNILSCPFPNLVSCSLFVSRPRRLHISYISSLIKERNVMFCRLKRQLRLLLLPR
ncbi:hypothetical protein XENOCAPTIV_005847 [Xenoophorus captivus]|uniref:Uncharacterized protein n=1 Tax=Xenoophorus captivus TaxID=1517983 RepID=A0ABV0R2M6_9TELE